MPIDLKKMFEKFAMEYAMGTHIERMLDHIHQEFTEYVNEQNNSNAGLCDLQNVNFMRGLTPDYTDKGQRSLYLLRYGAAYTVEYRAAYEEIFKGNHIEPGLVCVLSVGCGACLDKEPIFHTMQKYDDFKEEKLIYYGNDINMWGVDVFNTVNTTFIHKPFKDISEDDIIDNIDIIFFPKSLPEIDESELSTFVNNIKDIFWNKLCVIASNRKSDSDFSKAEKFVTDLCKKFCFQKTKTIIKPDYKEGTENIWEIFDNFQIPQAIIDKAKNPRPLCSRHLICDDDSCEDNMTRFPALKTSLFNTTIYCLERK